MKSKKLQLSRFSVPQGDKCDQDGAKVDDMCQRIWRIDQKTIFHTQSNLIIPGNSRVAK